MLYFQQQGSTILLNLLEMREVQQKCPIKAVVRNRTLLAMGLDFLLIEDRTLRKRGELPLLTVRSPPLHMRSAYTAFPRKHSSGTGCPGPTHPRSSATEQVSYLSRSTSESSTSGPSLTTLQILSNSFLPNTHPTVNAKCQTQSLLNLIHSIFLYYMLRLRRFHKPSLFQPLLTSSLSFHRQSDVGIPQIGTRNVLITAALPYVNNTPHLGNIIGGVLSADAYARYCRMRGYNVMFVSGTDEYGTTTEVKALEQGVSPQQICDKYYRIHKGIYEWFQIAFSHFGRTSDPIHSQITNSIFPKIQQNGFIERKKSNHFYCNHCQMPLADRYVKGECSHCSSKSKGDQCDTCSTIYKDPILELNNPKCSVCSHTPTVKESEHLYLKLSKMQSQLNEWLREGNGWKDWSHNAKTVTKAWIENKLQDRCITRDLKWGVKVPQKYFTTDASKVFYVWFQAPIGYISMTAGGVGQNWRKWWIPSQETKVELIQFMGKDNIVFHGTMAPATLMATGDAYVKPGRLAVTEYLMYEGGKFSKSNNYGVFGNDCQDTGIPSDVWRYYLLASRPESFDNEFTWEGLATRNNKDLLNSLGNMVNRVLKYTHSKLQAKVPLLTDISSQYSDLERSLVEQLRQLIRQYCEQMQQVQIKSSASKIIEISHVINKYIQDSEFWSKSNVSSGRNRIVIGVVIRVLEVYAVILSPFLPSTTKKILGMLSLHGHDHENQLQFFNKTEPHEYFKQIMTNQQRVNEENAKWEGVRVKKPQVLFEQICEKKLKELSAKYGTKK